ncbi:MAG: RHS repeat-associated core domain protein [Spirochaetes bacterium]|nr:MAG: RHS repeat-associated core domain protein [Spirochaetota bacterium]
MVSCGYDVTRSVTDSYRYGPEGLRYKKTEGTETTYYLYEGNELLLEETYVGGSRTSSKLNVFLGGMNLGRVQKVGGTESKQYFYTDHLGSRRAVLNEAGAIQAKIDYSVWGMPTVTNYNGYDGSKDISFTGKERDATGLYYFNARYYDASIGRFITEDPARNGMNWFVYCRNNPVRFVDPLGYRAVSYKEPAVGEGGTAGEANKASERVIGEPNNSISSQISWPISQGMITTVMGLTKPVVGNNGKLSKSVHNGIDIAVPVGTPVNSAGNGVVVQAGANGNYGNSVTNTYISKLT